MSERLELGLVALALIICGILWWTQYVAPKQDTLLAARECMVEQGIDTREFPHAAVADEWEACLVAAEAKHGSAVLAVVGY